MRPSDGYFFEHYQVGQKFVHATPRTITQGDVSLYQALTGSRNPLHCSEPFAQALGYPSMPVDDLLVFHIAFGKTVPDISYNAVANLGYADCRFVKPVFIGDTLRAETSILGLRQNSSGKTGVVYVRSSAFNQRDELVLTWARWVMVHRQSLLGRGDDSAAPRGVTDFPASVGSDLIKAPRFATVPDASLVSAATGSDVFWDDVTTLENTFLRSEPQAANIAAPIAHAGGITIDESDHTLATKLYQNTARVHFDLHHMKNSRFGQRLIYGGHIISLCRALAYGGLENALMIAAINSGTHHQPTFAGDTIYATSLPIAKWPIGADFGAIRLVMSGYKNVDPRQPEFASATDEAKVLSLDVTVIMPRRKKGKS